MVHTGGGGQQRFSMLCSMTMNGRVFFNHCCKVNEDTFLEHIKNAYNKVGAMVLVLDKAPWHTSKGVWAPMGGAGAGANTIH